MTSKKPKIVALSGGTLKPKDVWSVGIDQSYSGFAIVGLSKDASEYSYHYFSTEKMKDPVERLLIIRDWLYERIKEYSEAKFWAMEGYGYASQVGFMLGELGGMIKLALQDKTGAPPFIVAPSQVKKYLSGSGTSKKNLMLMQVYKKYGVEFTEDDMADAYVIARIAGGHADSPAERLIVGAVRG